MQHPLPGPLLHEGHAAHLRHLAYNRRWTILALVLWSALAGASLAWNIAQKKAEILAIAQTEARATFNRDKALRSWFTFVGGVYLPVKPGIEPSPFMAGFPDRDIVTPGGVALTRYSPATIIRLVMEEHDRLYGVKSRVTGLKHINPDNAPDPWERKALERFERGDRGEVSEVEEIAGKPYLRVIQPMYMEEKCLPCHAWTGIPVGGVRGANDVAVPLSPYLNIQDAAITTLSVMHGAGWLFGVVAIGFISRRNRQYEDKRQQAEAVIRTLAYHDALTGLPNRRLLHERLQQAMAWSHRAGTPMALMYVDLDRFKSVNDSLGHSVGDTLLQNVSSVLKAAVREGDVVARLGGDEFALVLGNLAHADDAAIVAQKIMTALETPLSLDGQEVYVTASIGISLYPEDTEDLDTLFSNADIAMYQAKGEGRNTFRFYSPQTNQITREHMNMEAGLRQALAKGELFLEYQPQADVQSGEIYGVEALVRWQSERYGLLLPDVFIPLAEEAHQIKQMGEWVLRTACADFQDWQARWPGIKTLSVNVSAIQLQLPGCLATVERVLAETSLPHGTLTLEITESALVKNPDETISLLQAISGLGVGISIDDFGTGYSSLAYLKRFPVHELKIDRNFISGLDHDPGDMAIIQAVVAMGRSLGMQVIAEGVETEAQLQMIRRLGCHSYQGYLLGHPMSPERLSAWLGTLAT